MLCQDFEGHGHELQFRTSRSIDCDKTSYQKEVVEEFWNANHAESWS